MKQITGIQTGEQTGKKIMSKRKRLIILSALSGAIVLAIAATMLFSTVFSTEASRRHYWNTP